MIRPLREAFEQTGPVVDLGNHTWQHAANDTLKFKRSLRGDGDAKILVPTAADRDIPCLVARGIGQHLSGFQMIGERPDGQPWWEKREAQHFVQMDGMKDGSITHVNFANGWGDGIYANRGSDGSWCDDIEIADCSFEEMGRHHVTLNAIQNSELRGGTMGWSCRSLVDCEPTGTYWGARYVTWANTLVTAAGNGNFVFANKGKGRSDTCHHLTIDGIRCPNRPFSMTVNPDPLIPGLRRHHYIVRNCTGKGPVGVNRPQITFRKTDHGIVQNVTQPVTSGPLVVAFDCTDIVHDGRWIA